MDIKEISKLISNNTVVSVLVFLGICLGWAGYIFWKRPRLKINVDLIPLEEPIFSNKTRQKSFIVKVIIKNFEDKTLDEEGITITFDPRVRVLEPPQLIYSSFRAIKISSKIDRRLNLVKLGLSILRPDDTVILEFICAGTPIKPVVSELTSELIKIELKTRVRYKIKYTYFFLLIFVSMFIYASLSTSFQKGDALPFSLVITLFAALFSLAPALLIKEIWNPILQKARFILINGHTSELLSFLRRPPVPHLLVLLVFAGVLMWIGSFQKPYSATEFFEQGESYYQKGDYKNAIIDFTKAINLKSDYKEAYLFRGTAYAKMMDYKDAKTDFEMAIEIDPDYALAYNDLCRYGTLLGYVNDVSDACDKAVLLEPYNGFYYDSRALSYALRGDAKRAVLDFELYILAQLEKKDYNLDDVNARVLWIMALSDGGNPFTESVLIDLLKK